MISVIGWITLALGSYLALGLVIGTAFAFLGVDRTDPGARGAGLWFRLIIVPGSAVLWPVVAAAWWRGGFAEHSTPEQNR